MLTDKCGRCRGEWSRPIGLTASVKRNALELRLVPSIAEPTALLARSGLSMRDAKAVALHLSTERSACHRCGSVLDSGDVVVCGECRALNYDWFQGDSSL